MDIEKLFLRRKHDALFNTSYPIRPDDWRQFRVEGELDYAHCEVLSFYIHIPFCQHLCRFCEYARFHVPNREIQNSYLASIEGDIEKFLNAYPTIRLSGFDIGGGTPTSLDEENFEYLMHIYKGVIRRVGVTADFEPSIEATFQTVTTNKLRLIAEAGIKRISLGIQSSVNHVQQHNDRVNPDVERMQSVLNEIYAVGVQKVNLDLMYGLEGQTLLDVQKDMEVIQLISPEQVTLYELRSNMLKMAESSSKDRLFQCYATLYKSLIDLGYSARFGQNTFTKNESDLGLSSYLRHRMIDFMPYKGFGLSAQSMSPLGVSYNVGKQGGDKKELLAYNSYPSKDTYQLPKQELLSKYIAVSAYYGQFRLAVADRILGQRFLRCFNKEVDFCLAHGYITLDDTSITITPNGFRYYGAVFSLFYRLAGRVNQN